MKVRTYRIERSQVGWIDVSEDDLLTEGEDVNDDNAWENAAFEMILSQDFETVDDYAEVFREWDE